MALLLGLDQLDYGTAVFERGTLVRGLGFRFAAVATREVNEVMLAVEDVKGSER